jgi:hypothetical protein
VDLVVLQVLLGHRSIRQGWGLCNAFGLSNPEDTGRRKRPRKGSLGWWANGIFRYLMARALSLFPSPTTGEQRQHCHHVDFLHGSS